MTCFDCGEGMVMQHTIQEGTRIYEWFECLNCRAQYLQLKATAQPSEAPPATSVESWASRQSAIAPA